VGVSRRPVAVLISGRGSNLEALIEHCARPAAPAAIALVVSNEPQAGGLAHAQTAGIAWEVVDHRACGGRTEFERRINSVLQALDIELICLAGFMRVLGAGFVALWRDRLLNIHPSLLPAYPGLDTHGRALRAGEVEAGCTVHLVTAGVDEGPVLGQARVPILPGDTEHMLSDRVLEQEHRLYAATLAEFVRGLQAP
jgi:phosphoribosylglycinamide formyltransferase-1/phosphoribosylamine--glycine ligase/phosphoribosylglycinamide formyltransferase/phosphoribosylformylglycinamidine cyclo-ligase